MYSDGEDIIYIRVQTRSRMAQNFGHEMGSPDLYRPNLLPENLGPCHKYARFDRKSPYQVRAHFHWASDLISHSLLLLQLQILPYLKAEIQGVSTYVTKAVTLVPSKWFNLKSRY